MKSQSRLVQSVAQEQWDFQNTELCKSLAHPVARLKKIRIHFKLLFRTELDPRSSYSILPLFNQSHLIFPATPEPSTLGYCIQIVQDPLDLLDLVLLRLRAVSCTFTLDDKDVMPRSLPTTPCVKAREIKVMLLEHLQRRRRCLRYSPPALPGR